MKRNFRCAVMTVLAFTALFAGCAFAAETRPTEIRPGEYWAGDAETAAEPADEIPVWKFFHALSAERLGTAVITAGRTDCEAGPIPCEVTEEEAESIRRIAMYGTVTGLESELTVTGGTWLYTFTTPEGEYLMTVEMYRGYLVGSDGMYNYTNRGNRDR